MRRFRFDKPLVESPYPPQDINVLWVDINESTGKVANIKKFLNGEWVDYLTSQQSTSQDTEPHVYAWEKYNIPNDEIWYTTRSGNKVQLVGVADIDNGEFYTFELEPDYVIDRERNNKVLYHEFDEEKQVFIIKCSQDIVDCKLGLYAESPGGSLKSTMEDISSLYLPNTVIDFSNGNPYFQMWTTFSLHTLVLSSSIKEIPPMHFNGQYLDIPSSVETLLYLSKVPSFFRVPNEIYYNGTKDQWNQIEKPDNYIEIFQDKTVHCTDGDVLI